MTPRAMAVWAFFGNSPRTTSGRGCSGTSGTVVQPSSSGARAYAKPGVRRLRTVADQALRDIEIILLDDASSDGSLGILWEFAANDKRARLLRNERNSGST